MNKSNLLKWTYCDKELPRPNEPLLLLVVELDHGQKPDDPNARRWYDTDFGSYYPDMSGRYGFWDTENDWDEGQPWAVVAWAYIPTYGTAADSEHKVEWYNG